MQSGPRRLAATVFGLGLALTLTTTSATADVIEPGFKKIPSRFLLKAGRYDDYCEHRCSIEKGDTFEGIAQRVYGDRARAADVAAANPKLEATKLPVGAKLVLPPKLAPPADAKETLAWTFWGYVNTSGSLPLQRIYPGEPTEPTGSFFELFAVPAANAAELEKLLDAAKAKNPRASGLWPEQVLGSFPSAIQATGLVMQTVIGDRSGAIESTTAVRIVELKPNAAAKGKFVVESDATEFRDRAGNVVKAGFDFLFSWRGIPLGLIALVGAVGLARMRRARAPAAAS
jgi:phage tail protein X